MNTDGYSVYGIGNPLMDLIARKPHSFLKEMGVTPGTMSLLDYKAMQELLEKTGKCEQVPGGSCANTLRGLAWLSQSEAVSTPVYNGAVGSDQRGAAYISLMETRYNIKTLISRGSSETGFSIIIVTPDFERTMFTYLGACREFSESGIDFDILGKARILHLNGYMWDTDNQKQAVTRAISFAREKGIRVSFDLADPFVVDRNRADFLSWLGEKVDILFGNQEEFSLLSGEKELDAIVAAAGKIAPLVVVKAGAAGCYVTGRKTDPVYARGNRVEAVDTVGAGDSFASGFLYGLLKEKDWADCAALANRVAAGIVSVEGCDFHKLEHSTVLG